MFILVLILNGALSTVQTPYPTGEACIAAGNQFKRVGYSNTFSFACIPAPVVK